MNCGHSGATDHRIRRSFSFPLADPNGGCRQSSFEFKVGSKLAVATHSLLRNTRLHSEAAFNSVHHFIPSTPTTMAAPSRYTSRALNCVFFDNKLSSSRLLKLALPLVKTHGFTREALSQSVLALPASEQHTEPLSDSAITALFGRGDLARRTLIDAWLEDGLTHMSSEGTGASDSTEAAGKATMRDVLRTRLQYNEPVLAHLPDVSYRAFNGTRLTNYE